MSSYKFKNNYFYNKLNFLFIIKQIYFINKLGTKGHENLFFDINNYHLSEKLQEDVHNY